MIIDNSAESLGIEWDKTVDAEIIILQNDYDTKRKHAIDMLNELCELLKIDIVKIDGRWLSEKIRVIKTEIIKRFEYECNTDRYNDILEAYLVQIQMMERRDEETIRIDLEIKEKKRSYLNRCA